MKTNLKIVSVVCGTSHAFNIRLLKVLPLNGLDVYKTALLPTHMRSSNLPASITATTTPDMFKCRRPSHLILMQDANIEMHSAQARVDGNRLIVSNTDELTSSGGGYERGVRVAFDEIEA